MPRHTTVAVALLVCLAAAVAVNGQSPGAGGEPELRWGGDAEGGAPFVEADPADTSRVVGFDVEVAALLAHGLGRTPRFVQSGFTSLDAAVARGDFDVALSGIEDSAARRARLAVTIPYYEFRELLTVRQGDTLTLAVTATSNLPAWVSYVGPNANLGDVTYRTAFAGYVPAQGVQLPTGFATTIDFRNVVQSKLYVDRNIVNGAIAVLQQVQTDPPNARVQQKIEAIKRLAAGPKPAAPAGASPRP